MATLSARTLNRTLLHRQHLLRRTTMPALAMAEHLLGLQAQEPLPPYLSLAARIDGFDPAELSAALERRTAVRVLLMRGTIHLVTPEDCRELRPLVQPMLDKITRNSQASKEAAGVPRAELVAATRAVLGDGALTMKSLGERLAERFPGVPAGHLANSARELLPLVQLPPRGMWKRSGGVVYDTAESWLGGALRAAPDPAEVVRRYLRAFGPASPADLTAWSRVTGMKAVVAAIRDELAEHRDEAGRQLFDLAGLPLADADTPAPVRLLGRYDNLWLSHADRDRVTAPDKRKRWMGTNGGVGCTVFVDGLLEGIWRPTQAGRVELELLRPLTRSERQDLDVEVARVEALLATP
ncbi:MAG: winged helix DNA-binding domain-containing protein [Nocardioidaceae bacterium]